jgi:hypothetical protein
VLAGLILMAAALLLWPFADWSWWPVVIGLGVLILLYLLRLDRVLLGWAPHLAGLVVVVLMAARSDPWAWGLAAGLAVLGVGFVRLPDWRLLAIGAALVVVFGSGYGIVHYRTAAQQQVAQEAAATEAADSVRAMPPELLLHAVTRGIAVGDDQTVCTLLGPAAGSQFATSADAPDCASAVRALRSQVTNRLDYPRARLPSAAIVKAQDASTATVDGCQAVWSTTSRAGAPGPRLGTFELRQFDSTTDRYLVTGYRPCP